MNTETNLTITKHTKINLQYNRVKKNKGTYINIKNNNFSCTNGIFTHVQEQNIPLQNIFILIISSVAKETYT